MGLLSLHPYGVDTKDVSIMVLYCCWTSYLPAILHNLLMFSKYLYSKHLLLLKYLSIPIGTICSINCSGCNIDFIINIVAKMYQRQKLNANSFFNALDLAHCAVLSVFKKIEMKNIIYQVWEMLLSWIKLIWVCICYLLEK